MKTFFRLSGIVLLITIFVSCEKKAAIVLDPEVVTSAVTEVLYATATTGGTVTQDGGGQVVSRGVCWSTNANPTINDLKTVDGTGTGQFESSISGLKFGTLYHVRAYATNSSSTVYGSDLTFTTKIASVNFNNNLTYGTVSDVDGMTYKTIPIGIQTWMAENLKTTRLNDGTLIPLIKTDALWANVIDPAYSWFDDNDTLYKNIYGAYYSWFAVNTGKLCPTGWHVPSDSEWQLLINYLGSNTAGSSLKEAGTNNWIFSNKDATNSSGFTALPAGMRGAIDGTFSGQGAYGGWWSGTENGPSPLASAWSRWVHGDTTVVTHSEIFKKDGFSVRCVKD